MQNITKITFRVLSNNKFVFSKAQIKFQKNRLKTAGGAEGTMYLLEIRNHAPRTTHYASRKGCSGGVKVLGKRSVPGRPTKLDDSRARTYCACSKCGFFGHFSLVYLFFFSFSLCGRRPDKDRNTVSIGR